MAKLVWRPLRLFEPKNKNKFKNFLTVSTEKFVGIFEQSYNLQPPNIELNILIRKSPYKEIAYFILSDFD